MTPSVIARARAELVLLGCDRYRDAVRSLAAAYAYPVMDGVRLPDRETLAQRAVAQACVDFAAGRRVRPQDYRGE